MAYDIFPPNTVKTAGVVLNLSLPSGLSCQVEVFLATAPTQTPSGPTSGKKAFTTVAPNTNTASIACALTTPTVGGIFNEYINLYDSVGNYLYGWVATNQAVVVSGTATVTWS
jgi:hypothetical protein